MNADRPRRARIAGQSEGFSLLEVLVVVAVILIISAAIAIPNLLGLRNAAKEASAVSSLQALNAAEATYFSTYGGTFSRDLGSLGPTAPGANPAPAAAGLIDNALAMGAKDSYLFSYSAGPADSSGRITSYTLLAAPTDSTGAHQYYSDQSGTVTRINGPAPSAESTPTACSESGNTVTVTSTLHPPVGSTIQWSGASPAGYNSGAGGWVVTSSSSGSFSFQNPNPGLGDCTAMGTVAVP